MQKNIIINREIRFCLKFAITGTDRLAVDLELCFYFVQIIYNEIDK